MKYYVIAGEASGDLHGSNLLRQLKAEDPGAVFRAWGGDLMEKAGAKLVKHYRDLAFMGFWEVAMNLRTILDNIAFCKKDILDFDPDVLILIDYPGFNLRIARWASKQGIRVFYYISPQLWAWHSSRVHSIKAHVERMFVILPFETDFYAGYGMEVDFVGHPLLDVVEGFAPDPDFRQKNDLDERPIVALLPGSRRQEISRMLEVMLAIVSRFPDHQFVIAEAPSIPSEVYGDIIREAKDKIRSPVPPVSVGRVQGQTYALLAHAGAALVTSGTATLETALFQVPEVVCYKGGKLSYLIARQLVNVEYISLVNLIVERELVPELIQDDLTPSNLEESLRRILRPENQENILKGYAELRERLGHAGASRRAAERMVNYLREA